MFIYYGNSPTSGEYSEALELADSLTGILKALTPLAGFVSTFFYNALMIYGYHVSYALSFSCINLGLLLYFFSKTIGTWVTLAIGRLLLGFGGGRVITRKYLASETLPSERKFWASLMVASTALSITVGPGISSLMEFVGNFDVVFVEIRTYNVFSLGFLILGLTIWATFLIIFTENHSVITPGPKINQVAMIENHEPADTTYQ